MTDMDPAPTSAEALRAAIVARYESLSRRLQQIARYVLDEPNAVALETLAVLSERMGVQPSAIVRFAKSFGFDGASQMQRLFRDDLLSGATGPGHGERARELARVAGGKVVRSPGQVLGEFVEGNVLALQNLGSMTGRADMAAAVRLIAQARTVYVAGFRGSFPVAAYLACSLHQVDRNTVFIDNLGGMIDQQANAMSKDDLLIAVGFHPYAEEAMHLVETAADRHCKVLSISDSLVSPVAKRATRVLQVREAEIGKLRALSASMCLAQALVVSCALAGTEKKRSASRPAKAARRR